MVEKTEEQILKEVLVRLKARITVLAEKEGFSALLHGGDVTGVTGRTPEKLHLLREMDEILDRLEAINAERS